MAARALSFRSILAGAMLVAALPAPALAQKIVFVVRHAERPDAGMSKPEADPDLSAAGRARAAKLAEMLSKAGIGAIYVTEFKRTQETAEPLARAAHVRPTSMSSKDTAALVADIRAHHGDDVVVIVGHSNTIPDIVKALGGPTITIGDDDYSNVFVLVPKTGAFTRIGF